MAYKSLYNSFPLSEEPQINISLFLMYIEAFSEYGQPYGQTNTNAWSLSLVKQSELLQQGLIRCLSIDLNAL